MANRVKEDEKNERIIRSLLKLPENRRCINCNSLGPQYVCTNFSTFVCTTCSGIHREFTHRVKSVSMAKFTSQEVSALQGGGNASAKEIYFKEWDSQRHSVPDGSNVERLREFIKHVYVERRYTGERSFDKPPRAKMGESEDLNGNRNVGSRSPPYEDTYDRRYSDRPSPGGRSDDKHHRNNYDERRSPGSDSDYRRSPARTDIVNDWRREDRFGNGRRSDESRISDGGSNKLEGRSPDRQSDQDISSPPVIRPVRDILGDNVSPLRIIEPPKANGGRSIDASVRTQRSVSSSSLTSSNGNPAELKTESSLIDFDAVPEPPLTTAVPKTQESVIGLSMVQPTTASNDNWANFDSVPEVKVSQAPSNANLLESVLSELSVPASLPATAPVGNASVSPFGGAPPVSNSMAFPSGGGPAAATGQGFNSLFSVDGGQWNTPNPQQQFPYPAPGGQTPGQPFTQAVGGASGNQPWNSIITPSTQVASSVSAANLSQTVPRPSGVGIQPYPAEVRPTEKKELPADLFSANYQSYPMPAPGWQIGPAYGFNMQYNVAAPMPTYPQPSKSTNPFDFSSDPSPSLAPTFPSMASLQGALPNMGAAQTGLIRTSSLGTPPQAWMPPQSSYPTAIPSQPQPYASAMAPSSYMGHQVPSSMPPPRQQGVMGYGSFNPNQQQTGLYSAPATPNAFSSVGGNPFG
ncbi:hypothetical protein LguiA_019937 [Lonicera macranthoides]